MRLAAIPQNFKESIALAAGLAPTPVTDKMGFWCKLAGTGWICVVTFVEDLRRREALPRFPGQLLVCQAAFRS